MARIAGLIALRRALPGLAALVGLFLISCGGESGGGETTGEGGGQGETTQASADTWAYELPGEQVYPEGVVYQRSSGDFFVSSTSDGAVLRGNVQEGGGEAEVFLEGGRDGRTSAIGLALDGEGRLFVAGGDTGRMFVYDTESGHLVDSFQNDRGETFVNDVIVVPSGDAYFTDSFSPVLYRLSAANGGYEFEEWLDLSGTPIEYVDGFNLNGIVFADDGRYLIVTHSTTGQLFRIDTQSEEVIEIDLGGDEVAGDGLVLDGRMLYAVTGDKISRVQLSGDYANGMGEDSFSYPSFKSPTTTDKYDERLLVVNSQFDARESGNPELPFTVSDVPIP
ncbi:MAG: SMP-30/gluconolactonase/LRE family protein [Actinomycetota bacterium]|nr:SMP-30/gluconolactonase/LRE family protein [Actinomycetota bacterium]